MYGFQMVGPKDVYSYGSFKIGTIRKLTFKTFGFPSLDFEKERANKEGRDKIIFMHTELNQFIK